MQFKWDSPLLYLLPPGGILKGFEGLRCKGVMEWIDLYNRSSLNPSRCFNLSFVKDPKLVKISSQQIALGEKGKIEFFKSFTASIIFCLD